jgi:hypothetical protein
MRDIAHFLNVRSTATGLVMKAFGGINFVVDGAPVDISTLICYSCVLLCVRSLVRALTATTQRA